MIFMYGENYGAYDYVFAAVACVVVVAFVADRLLLMLAEKKKRSCWHQIGEGAMTAKAVSQRGLRVRLDDLGADGHRCSEEAVAQRGPRFGFVPAPTPFTKVISEWCWAVCAEQVRCRLISRSACRARRPGLVSRLPSASTLGIAMARSRL